MTALIRNLATMTRVGLLAPGSDGTARSVRSSGTGADPPGTGPPNRAARLRREHRDRVHPRPADPLGIAQLRHDLGRRVRATLEQADPRHRREVADQRRHRHVLEKRRPDLGRREVLGLERLARQAVLTHERSRLLGRNGRLRPAEALDHPRQAVRRAAADDPLEEASVLARDRERGLPAPTRFAGWASRSRSRCVTPSRWRYLTAW